MHQQEWEGAHGPDATGNHDKDALFLHPPHVFGWAAEAGCCSLGTNRLFCTPVNLTLLRQAKRVVKLHVHTLSTAPHRVRTQTSAHSTACFQQQPHLEKLGGRKGKKRQRQRCWSCHVPGTPGWEPQVHIPWVIRATYALVTLKGHPAPVQAQRILGYLCQEANSQQPEHPVGACPQAAGSQAVPFWGTRPGETYQSRLNKTWVDLRAWSIIHHQFQASFTFVCCFLVKYTVSKYSLG